jgi:hypothetical protein
VLDFCKFANYELFRILSDKFNFVVAWVSAQAGAIVTKAATAATKRYFIDFQSSFSISIGDGSMGEIGFDISVRCSSKWQDDCAKENKNR